jgi:hypothetical protein
MGDHLRGSNVNRYATAGLRRHERWRRRSAQGAVTAGLRAGAGVVGNITGGPKASAVGVQADRGEIERVGRNGKMRRNATQNCL